MNVFGHMFKQCIQLKLSESMIVILNVIRVSVFVCQQT